MEEQKLISDKISENSKVSNEIYQAITEMINLVKLNGVSLNNFKIVFDIILKMIIKRF